MAGSDYRPYSIPTRPGADMLSGLRGGVEYATFKVVMDYVLAVLLLVLMAPLILAAMVLVKATSRGPAIYSQTRLGRNGRTFRIYKIRTMYHNCEVSSGPRWSTPGDPRITPIGRFLRFSHLDELLQLWNVLRGEMSLVGPRPERPEFAAQLEQAIPHYRGRLFVRPGLTGLAQVQLPPDTDLASVRCKLVCDLFYIERLSFWLDLRILAATACLLVGIPLKLSCRLFRVPDRATIGCPYPGLATEIGSLPQVQSA
ncbi:MAG: sugar transferase [Isosphaeraceae bacterium]|nr:sugar transferase [Isosphaeraceae bacterium]